VLILCAAHAVTRIATRRLRHWPLALAFYTWFDNAMESAYLRNKASNAIFMYAGATTGSSCSEGTGPGYRCLGRPRATGGRVCGGSFV
jgi:hypothetical protein